LFIIPISKKETTGTKQPGRRRGKTPPALNTVIIVILILPDCFVWLFSEYLNIRSACNELVTYQDLCAYSQAMQCNFSIYETKLIMRMDQWGRDEFNKALKENQKT
jgi:hypothetical protein